MSESLETRALAAQAQTLPWIEGFLNELLRTQGDTDAAADLVHISVPELHAMRQKNKAFALAWARALDSIRVMRAEHLETVAFHEAAFPTKKYRFTPSGEGLKHPVTGEPYFEADRDNRLVIALLKALNKDVYSERREITGAGGGAIQHIHSAHTLADIVRLASMVEAGALPPTEVVGELDDTVLDAEVVG